QATPPSSQQPKAMNIDLTPKQVRNLRDDISQFLIAKSTSVFTLLFTLNYSTTKHLANHLRHLKYKHTLIMLIHILSAKSKIFLVHS
ncbi:13479_t:CDS:1, partial [Ambispora leptoticha]